MRIGEGRIWLVSDVRSYEEGVDLDGQWMRCWKHDDGF